MSLFKFYNPKKFLIKLIKRLIVNKRLTAKIANATPRIDKIDLSVMIEIRVDNKNCLAPSAALSRSSAWAA